METKITKYKQKGLINLGDGLNLSLFLGAVGEGGGSGSDNGNIVSITQGYGNGKDLQKVFSIPEGHSVIMAVRVSVMGKTYTDILRYSAGGQSLVQNFYCDNIIRFVENKYMASFSGPVCISAKQYEGAPGEKYTFKVLYCSCGVDNITWYSNEYTNRYELARDNERLTLKVDAIDEDKPTTQKLSTNALGEPVGIDMLNYVDFIIDTSASDGLLKLSGDIPFTDAIYRIMTSNDGEVVINGMNKVGNVSEEVFGNSIISLAFVKSEFAEDKYFATIDCKEVNTYYTKHEVDEKIAEATEGIETGNCYKDAHRANGDIIDGAVISEGLYSNNHIGDYAFQSFVGGSSNVVTGRNSAVFGSSNVVSGAQSLVVGNNNTAPNSYSFVSGRYAEPSTDTNPNSHPERISVWTVGNGEGANKKGNAIDVRANGDIYGWFNGEYKRLQDVVGEGVSKDYVDTEVSSVRSLVNGKAEDSNVVHLNGYEVIRGEKTFTDYPYFGLGFKFNNGSVSTTNGGLEINGFFSLYDITKSGKIESGDSKLVCGDVVARELRNYLRTSRLVTSIDYDSTNEQIPSAKAVYEENSSILEYVDNKTKGCIYMPLEFANYAGETIVVPDGYKKFIVMKSFGSVSVIDLSAMTKKNGDFIEIINANGSTFSVKTSASQTKVMTGCVDCRVIGIYNAPTDTWTFKKAEQYEDIV